VIKGHSDAIWDLSYHRHRSLLLSASSDATVKLWNIENGTTSLLNSAVPPHLLFAALKGKEALEHTIVHPANDIKNDDYIPTTVRIT